MADAQVPVIFGSYSVPSDWWAALYNFVRAAGHVASPFDGNCQKITTYLAIGAAESGWRVDADGAYPCGCCSCGECGECNMCSPICDGGTKSPWDKAREHYGDAYTSHGPYQLSTCGGQARAYLCNPAELHQPATHFLIALPPIRDAINRYWDNGLPIETNICNAATGSGHPCSWPGCIPCDEYRIQNIIKAYNNMRTAVCDWLAGNAPPTPIDPNCEPSPMPDLPFGVASARPMPALPPDTPSAWPMPNLPTQGSPCAGGGGGSPSLVWQCPLRGSFAVSQRYGEAYLGYHCTGELPDCSGGRCTGGHSGVDLDTFGANISVYPAAGWADGSNKVWVARVGYDSQWGNHVVLRHADNHYTQTVETAYAHLRTVYVTQNTWITSATNIGLTGTTGLSSGIHLHFEVRKATLPDLTCGCIDAPCYQRRNPAIYVPCVA